MQFDDGYLVVLERDPAKEFFGHRDNDARLAFLTETLQGDAPSIPLEKKWQPLHDALVAVELEDSVLGQCILGGRPMHRGDDFHVCMVRPDIVGFVAQQAAQVDTSKLDDDIAELANSTLNLFKTAAQQRAAVVFVAKR